MKGWWVQETICDKCLLLYYALEKIVHYLFSVSRGSTYVIPFLVACTSFSCT
ncbi:hypothetical protein Mapa_005441 [Marchantia paleacea]|nr:hypothetical protein Mapa_005441 [Marchantia paleacea]